MPILHRCLAAAVPLLIAGCSFDAFTYTVDRYGAVKATHVHLSCRDTYEVFDRAKDRTLLVVTNPVNEVLAASCTGSTGALPREERMRRIAGIFLAETTDRPDCRIVSARELGDRHTEFTYACGGAAPTEPPRGPKRRG